MRVSFFIAYLLVGYGSGNYFYRRNVIFLSLGLLRLASGDILENHLQLQENETTSFQGKPSGEIETMIDQQQHNDGKEKTDETRDKINQILERIIPAKSERVKRMVTRPERNKKKESENAKPLDKDIVDNDTDDMKSLDTYDYFQYDKNKTSPYFNGVISSIHFIAKHYQLLSRRCKDRCGISEFCSCKPICLIFKTCCIDFMESCGTFYNMTRFQEEYRWLYSVETECIDGNTVVSSCRPQNPDEHSSHFQQRSGAYATPNSALSSWENALHNDTYAQNNGPIIYLLVHLLSISKEPGRQLSKEESMLLSTPILDSTTGITYRNISTYTCNKAAMEHAVVISLFVAVEEAEFRSKANANPDKSYIDVLKIANSSKSCLCNRYDRTGKVQDNTEKCMPYGNNMIHSCPNDFLDTDVIEACQNYSFLISRVRKDEKNSATIYEAYKNPFCLFCHIFNHSDERLTLSLIDTIACPCGAGNQAGFAISFSQHEQSYHFTVDKKYGTTYSSLSCNVTFHNNDLGTPPTNTTPLNHLKKPSLNLKSGCKAEDCEQHLRESNRCLGMWVIFLFLPPTRVILSDEYLGGILQIWRGILSIEFPGYWREVNTSSVYFSRFDKTRIKSGYEYDYSMQVGVFSEMLGLMSFRDKLETPLRKMFSNESLIFKTRQNYICLTFARSFNGNVNYCYPFQRVTIPVENDTDSTFDSSRSSPLQLTFELCQLFCFFLSYISLLFLM